MNTYIFNKQEELQRPCNFASLHGVEVRAIARKARYRDFHILSYYLVSAALPLTPIGDHIVLPPGNTGVC